MDRDRRLTGYLRGQTDQAKAPAGFELSNPWRVCTIGLEEFAQAANFFDSLREASARCTYTRTKYSIHDQPAIRQIPINLHDLHAPGLMAERQRLEAQHHAQSLKREHVSFTHRICCPR